MPLALILRLLARIALAGAMSRRNGPTPWRTPGQPGPRSPSPSTQPSRASQWVARRLGTAVEVGRIVVHVVAATVFLAGAGTLVAAGTTLTTLGPRWVGIILLVLAAVAALVGVGELRVTLRLRRTWRLRRSAERLRGAGA